MPRYVPMDPDKHKTAGFQKTRDWGHAAQDWVAPVVVDELPQIIPVLPLAFIPMEEDFQLVAVQSLKKDKNVVIRPGDGRWLTPYVPAIYRGYPFSLMQVGDKSEKALCVDEESPVYRSGPEPGYTPFYDEAGNPSEIVKKVMEFWELYETQRQKTSRAVHALSEQNVIVPWEIKVQSGEGHEPVYVEGLYKVDEGVLNTLSLASLENIRRAGALPVAYAQIFSQHRLNVLAKLHHVHEKPAAEAPEKENDIDTLFGADDKFRF